MNCQDISLILDTRDVRLLTATEGGVVEAHLHGCAECANEWQAHQQALGIRVPEMASDLPGRMWSFLEAPTARRVAGTPVRRPLVFGGLLFVGAAAAMIGWLSLREPALKSMSMAIPAVIESDAVMTATEAQEEVILAQPEVPAPEHQRSDTPALAGSALRHTLIVLPPRHENLDPAGIAYFNVVYAATLGDLRSKPDLEIIEVTARAVEMAEAAVSSSLPSPPLPTEMPPLPPGWTERGIVLPPPSANNVHDIGRDHAIVRHLGGDYTLRMSLTASSSGYWSIDTRYRASPRNGGFSHNGTTGFGINQSDDPKSFGAMIARRVYAGILPDSAISQYLPILRDERETETRRLDVLREALDVINPGSDSSSAAVLQEAVELSRSSVPETRRRVSQMLRPDSPTAVEALRNAMLSDPEVEVQREAINSLFNAPIDIPYVRAAFESAVSDPSPVVRVLAKMALMPNGERPAFVISTLHDRSLTPEARAAPLMIARRNPSAVRVSLDESALSSIVEIAEGSSDPAIKAAARAEISRASRAR